LCKAKRGTFSSGCGSGRDSLYFLNKGYRVTAIDASKELSKLDSKLIKQPVLNISYQEIDFENEFDRIAFSEESFDFNS
jgi:SAM-dependent methyltransferase